LIIERCNELVVSGKLALGVPLQMANEYVQNVAMSDCLGPVSQIDRSCRLTQRGR
jgi:hypothetical protein